MGFITKLDISTSCDFGSQMTQYASLNQNLNKKVVCPYNYLNYIPLNDIINGKYFPSEWVSINKN
jgi:hypothetical protein